LAGKLGGNRRDFWTKMKHEKIGLITYRESEVDLIEEVDEGVAKEVNSRCNSADPQFFKD